VFLGSKAAAGGGGWQRGAHTVIETRDDLTGLGTVLASRRGASQPPHSAGDTLLVGCPWSSFKPLPTMADGDSINRGVVLEFAAPGATPPAGCDTDSRGQCVLDARANASVVLDGSAGYGAAAVASLLCGRFD
jgi:hypothetical protein